VNQEPSESTDTKPTIIYIMGYGRSGSTILDIILNQHDDIVSVGALNNIYKWVTDGHACACAESLSDCTFWRGIIKILENKYHLNDFAKMQKIQSRVESLATLPLLLLFNKWLRPPKGYAYQTGALFHTIHGAHSVRFIVDSSKSTRDCSCRPIALHRYVTDVGVKCIHLVRDGRAVVWSAMKGPGSYERRRWTNNRYIIFLRTLVGWIAINTVADMTARALPHGLVLVVKYEDLCDKPEATLCRIADFIGVDLSQVIENVISGKTLKVGHNLGGNRVRFSKHLVFKPDTEWKNRLPSKYRKIFWMVAGRFAKQFGYTREGSD